MLPAVNWEWGFYSGKTGTEPSSIIIWYHFQSLSHLIFASQSCLSLDSSLAHPLGPAQSLTTQQPGPVGECVCEEWLLLVQNQKHRFFFPKIGYSFFVLFLCPVFLCLCMLKYYERKAQAIETVGGRQQPLNGAAIPKEWRSPDAGPSWEVFAFAGLETSQMPWPLCGLSHLEIGWPLAGKGM